MRLKLIFMEKNKGIFINSGFTMIELLMVIAIASILSVAALPKFLDYRKEAYSASAESFVTSLRSAIAMKKVQMVMQCQQNSWPRLEAILQNDVTESGSAEAKCSLSQIPDSQARRFLDRGIHPIPVNPYNLRNDIVITNCQNICDCPDEGGYLYNPQTGLLGHKNLLKECNDQVR